MSFQRIVAFLVLIIFLSVCLVHHLDFFILEIFLFQFKKGIPVKRKVVVKDKDIK